MPRPPSLQIQSVLDAFGQQGWHAELIEGREVIETSFEAHHAHVRLIAQAFPELNALSIVAENPLALDEKRRPLTFELLMRANKQLTIGGFEYDLERSQLVFRTTNLFEREKYDADIICSLVHCAIAELDRLTPCVSIINRTPDDLLSSLSPACLLLREDILPPIPDGEEEEEL